jgi:hypothetical protein
MNNETAATTRYRSADDIDARTDEVSKPAESAVEPSPTGEPREQLSALDRALEEAHGSLDRDAVSAGEDAAGSPSSPKEKPLQAEPSSEEAALISMVQARLRVSGVPAGDALSDEALEQRNAAVEQAVLADDGQTIEQIIQNSDLRVLDTFMDNVQGSLPDLFEMVDVNLN